MTGGRRDLARRVEKLVVDHAAVALSTVAIVDVDAAVRRQCTREMATYACPCENGAWRRSSKILSKVWLWLPVDCQRHQAWPQSQRAQGGATPRFALDSSPRGVNESEHTWRAQIRRDAATQNEIAFEKLVVKRATDYNFSRRCRPDGFAPGFVSRA